MLSVTPFWQTKILSGHVLFFPIGLLPIGTVLEEKHGSHPINPGLVHVTCFDQQNVKEMGSFRAKTLIVDNSSASALLLSAMRLACPREGLLLPL